MDYKGYNKLVLNDDQMADFYGNPEKYTQGMLDNQYLLIYNDVDINAVDKYIYRNGKLNKVKFQTINSSFGGKVKPRNDHQELAIDMLKDDKSTIKLITGTWGTGKTMLLAAAAIEALEKNKFEKIVWIRNNIAVRDTTDLGALPGSEFEKMLPYVMPLADHCGGIEGINYMISSGRLEVIPLGFLRGRSIRDSIIISSEAENLTKQHLQLMIGRVDDGSNLWMDADLKQRDKSVFEKSAGLETLVDRLKGNDLFGYVHLEKVERSATARLADKLD